MSQTTVNQKASIGQIFYSQRGYDNTGEIRFYTIRDITPSGKYAKINRIDKKIVGVEDEKQIVVPHEYGLYEVSSCYFIRESDLGLSLTIGGQISLSIVEKDRTLKEPIQ